MIRIEKIACVARILLGSLAVAGGVAVVATPVEVCAQSQKTINLKGKIGGKYEFTMKLSRTSDGSVSGHYWYGNGKNGKLSVSGYRESDGTIRLDEYNPDGDHCGSWVIKIRREGSKYVMRGHMINYKGQQFSLTGYQF